MAAPSYVQFQPSAQAFQIANGKSTKIYVDPQDIVHPGYFGAPAVQFNLNNTLKSANRNDAR